MTIKTPETENNVTHVQVGSAPPQPLPERDDLNSKVAALIALALKEKPSQPDGWGTKAGSIVSVIAAFGALLGAIQALYISTQASETQRQINETQKEIIQRQEKIDLEGRLNNENARINNVYFHMKNKTCAPIPIDETKKWDTYCQCLFPNSTGCSVKSTFSEVSDTDRVTCLSKENLKMCRDLP